MQGLRVLEGVRVYLYYTQRTRRRPRQEVQNIQTKKTDRKMNKNDVPLPEDSVLFNKGVAEGRRLERKTLAGFQ